MYCPSKQRHTKGTKPMKNTVIYIVALLLCTINYAYGQISCPNYTEEQQKLIYKAYNFGYGRGYEITLPAIVVQESFVGDKIVRYNPSDPSTGITQIQFKTLQHLSGLSHYEAAIEAERLVHDDRLAMYYAVLKLDTVKTQSFWYKWKRYNGTGIRAEQYANKIQKITKQLQYCMGLRPYRSENFLVSPNHSPFIEYEHDFSCRMNT